MSFVIKWMQMENILLNKLDTEQAILYVLPYMWKVKINLNIRGWEV